MLCRSSLTPPLPLPTSRRSVIFREAALEGTPPAVHALPLLDRGPPAPEEDCDEGALDSALEAAVAVRERLFRAAECPLTISRGPIAADT